MRFSVTALLVTAVFGALAACGQTGPLYMPAEPPPDTQAETPVGTQPQVQPATPADITAQPTPGP